MDICAADTAEECENKAAVSAFEAREDVNDDADDDADDETENVDDNDEDDAEIGVEEEGKDKFRGDEVECRNAGGGPDPLFEFDRALSPYACCCCCVGCCGNCDCCN